MKTDFGLTATDLLAMLQILEKEPALEQAILFGSRAKGNYKPGSDVDIALKGKGLNMSIVTNISSQLNEETTMPYRFDVLNYHAINEPALVNHIDRVGVVLYEKQPKKAVA